MRTQSSHLVFLTILEEAQRKKENLWRTTGSQIRIWRCASGWEDAEKQGVVIHFVDLSVYLEHFLEELHDTHTKIPILLHLSLATIKCKQNQTYISKWSILFRYTFPFSFWLFSHSLKFWKRYFEYLKVKSNCICW
jgi:hypothetical protein